MYLPQFICRLLVRLPNWARWLITAFIGILITAIVLAVLILNGNLANWTKELSNPYLIGLIVGFVGLIAGVLGNVASERYLDWEKARLPSVENFFRNHDLSKLVGQSLAMVLYSVSERLIDKTDRLTTLDLAQNLEQNWPTIANSAWANDWLANIKDDQLVAFIRDPQKPALTEEQVAALLRKINPNQPDHDPVFTNPANAYTVRQEIINRFGEALRQGLKRDFANDGQAAMGMILDISAALLNRSLADLPESETKRKRVQAIKQTVNQELKVTLTSKHLNKQLDTLAGSLDSLQQAVHEEGLRSALRDALTHRKLAWLGGGIAFILALTIIAPWQQYHDQQVTQAQLAEIQATLVAFKTPKQADKDGSKAELPPKLLEQAKILLKRGNREQQAVAEIALKNHDKADAIIQELKKNPLAEAFRLLTYEGNNWYDAGQPDKAIPAYEKALALQPDNFDTKNALASAYLNAHLGNTQNHLQLSENLFRENLNKSKFHSNEWAVSQGNIGNTLQAQGIRSKGIEAIRLLSRAVAAYRSVLEVYTRQNLPYEWARTQNNLGIALYEKGLRSNVDEAMRLLSEAVESSIYALEVRTRQDLPEEWAITQNNLGLILVEQGKRSSEDEAKRQFAEAIKIYLSTLEVLTRQATPQLWAKVQYNLGNALYEESIRSSKDEAIRLLDQASSAFRFALEVRTRHDMPQDWAITQNNLGAALFLQAKRSSGAESNQLLVEVVEAFRSSLEVYTRQDLPYEWARTQINLGLALYQYGIRSSGNEATRLLSEAVKTNLSALEIYTRKDFPDDWAVSQRSLADAYTLLKKWPEALEVLYALHETIPDDIKILSKMNFILQDRLFYYDHAFKLNQSYLEKHPYELGVQCVFAENNLTTGRFAEAVVRFDQLIQNPKVEENAKVAMTILKIAALQGQAKPKEVEEALSTLTQRLKALPDNFKLEWGFQGTKHFISQHNSLRQHTWLLELLEKSEGQSRDNLLKAISEAQARR